MACAITFSSLISMLLLEFGLRLAFGAANEFLPFHPNNVSYLYPTPEIAPGIEGISTFSTNEFGTRGPSFDREDVRILTVGGSTTACTYLDDSEAWPELLRVYLNEGDPPHGRVWVTNSGIDGKNSEHHVMHARYLVPALPQLDYVLLYAGLNDVGLWLYKENYDPNFLQAEGNWNARVGQSFRVSAYVDPKLPAYKRLAIWRQASVLKHRWSSWRRGDDGVRAGRIIQDERMQWLAEVQARRKNGKKSFVHRAKMETLPAALESYARNLRMFIADVRAAGAEPIFVSQAIQHVFLRPEERERLWMGAMDGGETYVKEEQMLRLLLAYNNKMASVAAAENVLFVDLPELLADQTEIFYDGVHFNEHGGRVTARALADVMIRVLASRKPV